MTVYTEYTKMSGGFIIFQTDKRPIYLQIMEQIKQRIAVGDWTEGQSIPSIRQLAVDLQVSVITVKRAYLELEREGVIVTQQGKGSQVAQNPGLGNAAARRRTEKSIWNRRNGWRICWASGLKNWKGGFAKPVTVARRRSKYEGSGYRTRRRGEDISFLHTREHSPESSARTDHGFDRAERRRQIDHYPHSDGAGTPGPRRSASPRTSHARRTSRRQVGHRVCVRGYEAV